jgi:two-component system cell cycle sensor histidine kinase PleC
MAHEPTPVEVATTAEDVLLITRTLAEAKQQTVRADIAAGLPPLHADPVHFKQILFNLLTNAVKFTPHGGAITLRARPAAPIAGAPPALEIAVEDTGVGIAEQDLPRLFREFSQLERAAGELREGAGLGLALTKRLVELHGGTIAATSAGRGQGATFTLRLPVASPGG